MRFEELEDSGDDYEHSVDFNSALSEKRFASDELHFTGIDLSSTRARRRRTKDAYDEDSAESEDDHYAAGLSDEHGQNMQIMLREKEDLLVERALERMRRARELGKTNVRLTQAEIDALERAEQRQRLSAAPKPPKSRKAVQTRPKLAEKKSSKGDRSSGSSPSLKAIEPRRRGTSSATGREVATLPYPMLSDEQLRAGGAYMYPPQGYYGPPAGRPSGSTSRSGSRNPSSHSLRQQQHTPPFPQYQPRYYSNPDTASSRPSPSSSRAPPYPRPDPSDPNWEPRNRSESNLVPYPIDAMAYQLYSQPSAAPLRFDPNDPRFASPQARRIASGPPDVYASQTQYRGPPDELFLNRPSPDRSSGEGSKSTEDDEDDGNEGVLVEVTDKPGGDYGVQTRATAAAVAAAPPGNKGRRGSPAKRGKRTR